MARPGLTTHRKFQRLARILGSEPLARGVLELLWDSAYECGEPYLGDSTDVEVAARWSGETGRLTDALLAAGGDDPGFIEEVPDRPGRYQVHDLWDHAPDYVLKRRQREMERIERRNGLEHHKRRTSVRRAADTDCRAADTVQSVASNSDPAVGTPAPAPAPAPAPKKLQRRTPLSSTRESPSADADGARVFVPEDLRSLWNAHAPPLPTCLSLTAPRLKAARSRLHEHPDAAYWQEVLVHLVASPFCLGQSDRGWRASFDWLLRPDSATKVLEGKYDRVVRLTSPKTAGNSAAVEEWLRTAGGQSS